jgi:hypothetical protein
MAEKALSRVSDKVVDLGRIEHGAQALTNALLAIGAGLQSAIAQTADDLIVEVENSCEAGRSSTKFRLRAYRHRKE